MSDLYGSDAYSPVEIARRIESVGEAKARLGLWPLALLFPLPVPLGVGQITEPLRPSG